MNNDILDLAILQDDRKELEEAIKNLVNGFIQKYPQLSMGLEVAIISRTQPKFSYCEAKVSLDIPKPPLAVWY